MLFLRHLLLGEETSGTQRDTHGGKVVRADDADICDGKVHERLLWLAQDVDTRGRTQSHERRKTLYSGRADAGNGADASEQLSEESHQQWIFGVLGLWKEHLEGELVARINLRIGSDQLD